MQMPYLHSITARHASISARPANHGIFPASSRFFPNLFPNAAVFDPGVAISVILHGITSI